MQRIVARMMKGGDAAAARTRAGNMASLAGLCANLLLAGVKFIVGALSASLAVTADAVNNLSDALSSVLALAGFYFSSRPADHEHPYGHLRAEFLLSMAVGMSVLAVGGRLAYGAVQKIWEPSPVALNGITALVLALSLLVKGAMYFFYRAAARAIDSAMLRAAAFDSVSDVLSGGAVLVSLALGALLKLPLDGWMGAAVSLLIMKNGLSIVSENVSRLLGRGANDREGAELLSFIKAQPGVMGAHDLMVHDYGPGRRYASVDCEMDADFSIEKAHLLADQAERAVESAFHVRLSIHVDPVRRNDRALRQARKDIQTALRRAGEGLRAHDIRVEREGEGLALYFDLLVPAQSRQREDEIRVRTVQALRDISADYRPVIRMERSFENGKG